MRQKRFGVDTVRVALVEKVNEQGLCSAARDLGFDPSHISRVLNGRQDITDKLARALGFEPVPREYTRSK